MTTVANVRRSSIPGVIDGDPLMWTTRVRAARWQVVPALALILSNSLRLVNKEPEWIMWFSIVATAVGVLYLLDVIVPRRVTTSPEGLTFSTGRGKTVDWSNIGAVMDVPSYFGSATLTVCRPDGRKMPVARHRLGAVQAAELADRIRDARDFSSKARPR